MYKLISWLCLAIVVTVAIALNTALQAGSQASLTDSVVAEMTVAEITAAESDLSEDLSETDSVSTDSLSLPPTQQRFTSGDYQLVIVAADHSQASHSQASHTWPTENAIATLYRNNTLQWEQALPHAYGPRFVVLTPQGQTLLLDEFINVASPYAITLITCAGEQTAQYSFADIAAVLDLPAATITEQASSGWWISMPPELSPSNHQVFIQTGGQRLTIELITGELTVSELTSASVQ